MPKVKSSHLRRIEYDEDFNELKIKFWEGSEYHYTNVKEGEFNVLLNALSKGKKFWRSIRQIKPTILVKKGNTQNARRIR